MPDIEILWPRDRRRIWGAQEKAALLAEVEAEGGKVRLVARRYGLSERLLYNWRSVRRSAAVAAGAPEDVTFVPIAVVEDKAPRASVLLALPEAVPAPELAPAESKAGVIEIVLPGGARISVVASVNEKALSRVLRAMKGLT